MVDVSYRPKADRRDDLAIDDFRIWSMIRSEAARMMDLSKNR